MKEIKRIEMLANQLAEGKKEYRDEASLCAALLVLGCKKKKEIFKLSKVGRTKFNRIWGRLNEGDYFDYKTGCIIMENDGKKGIHRFVVSMLLMVLVARGFIRRKNIEGGMGEK